MDCVYLCSMTRRLLFIIGGTYPWVVTHMHILYSFGGFGNFML